jgi:hypothetical protein
MMTDIYLAGNVRKFSGLKVSFTPSEFYLGQLPSVLTALRSTQLDDPLGRNIYWNLIHIDYLLICIDGHSEQNLILLGTGPTKMNAWVSGTCSLEAKRYRRKFLQCKVK